RRSRHRSPARDRPTRPPAPPSCAGTPASPSTPGAPTPPAPPPPPPRWPRPASGSRGSAPPRPPPPSTGSNAAPGSEPRGRPRPRPRRPSRGHPRARKRLRSFHTVLHATAFAVAHGRKPAHDARTRRHSSHGAVSPTGARRSPYLQPARSKIATAAAFSSPSRARFSVSAFNPPHPRRLSAGATRGFTGYSRFASEKIRCASSLARNSSNRIAFATIFELAVTPAPLT